MLIEIKVPDIGSEALEITEIMVKAGDKVEVEQSLITVEGDKTAMELPSPREGVVKEIKVAVGDIIETGKLMMIFDVEGASEGTSMVKEEARPILQSATTAKDVKVPDIGTEEVTVTEVMVQVGDKVTTEKPLITIEGEKVLMEVPAPFDGVVMNIRIKPGDKVKTGSLIMVFTVEHLELSTAATASHAKVIPVPVKEEDATITPITNAYHKSEFSENDAYVHATPVVRRLAREFGINLAKVKGSSRKGRILREDIQNYVKDITHRIDATPRTELTDVRSWPKVDFSKFGETEEVDIGRIQKVSGANLSRNWAVIPHVTHFDKADITELEVFRKQQNEDAIKSNLDVKFTLVVFIIKAVAVALEQMPRFNSSLSVDSQKLILKKYINIGIAVDTPSGLLVPVLKDVNKKGITGLARELMFIAKKARNNQLVANDMQGGCLTISSLGSMGTTYFAPIINAPEVAILGVSKSTIEPIWNGKKFVPRLIMPISLSFDHRVIDGADGVRFITIINNILSDIRRLVM